MPISTQDIKIFASQVMSDVPEGGGGPSAVVLQSGKSNNVFRDIREQDRAGGNLSMRQLHLGITSGDTDVAMGCHVIVSEPPSDPNVSIVLMSTQHDFATREQDVARLEAGFIASVTYPGQLLGDHVRGMSVINLIQRADTTLPRPGQRLVLVYHEGSADAFTQYVSIRKVDHTLRTFEDGKGAYERRVVTLYLGQSLERDFPGFDAQRETIADSALRGRTKVRETIWGNATKYYGIKPLLQSGVRGQYSVQVPGIYERVVPSSEAESPIVDAIPIAGAALPVGAVEDVAFTTAQAWNTGTALVLPGGCLPGRLRITAGATQITDNGGLLMVGSTQVGVVDYQNGICTLLSGSYSGSKSVTYRPAAWIQRQPQSSEIVVTPEGRSQSYTGFILPLAAPGTLSVHFMAQGRWYVLQDDGSGQLRGAEASYGAGTYNPASGSYVVTLGALPDVGSSVILYWGVPTQETHWPTAQVPIYQDLDLPLPQGASIYPGGLTITWPDGAGGTKTATAASDMTLVGDAAGRVYVGENRIRFVPNALPAVGAQITVEVNTAPVTSEHYDHPSRDAQGKLRVQAAQGGWVPGSVRVRWNTLTDEGFLKDSYVTAYVDPVQDARDDGAGHLLRGDQIIGSVDYAAGEVTFDPDVTLALPRAKVERGEQVGPTVNGFGVFRQNYAGIDYVPAPSLYPNDERGWVKLSYYTEASPAVETYTVPFAPELQVLPGIQAPLLPGSLLLKTPSGALWADRLGGVLQEYINGVWLTRGQIDLVTGRAQLSSWQVGAAPTLTRLACTSTLGDALSSVFVFRAAAAPIRPGSLSLQLPAAGGGLQIVTSTPGGELVGDGVRGTVDAETGLVRLAFGRMVPVTEIEGESWFNPATVQGSLGWRPDAKVMSSLRYAAVAYEHIPVDPAIIGVNPVRLPSDGRVPIFEAGDYAVVHTSDSLPAQTVVDGQEIDLGMQRLSRIVITGADGNDITHGWARDLDAGTVKVLTCADWAQPVTITYGIEHMALVREAQIGGQITLNRPLTHNFPANGKSFVSSALMLGDRYARVSSLFDQKSWNGIDFLDYPSGEVAIGTYDTRVAPVLVDNTGCITQRWAIQVTSPGVVRVVGESVGVIATGHPISTDLAPINPITGTPYFTLKKEGWGSDWAQGNLLRMNTVGAGAGFCVIRAVQPGDYSSLDHRFGLLARVDVDRPGAGD